MKKIRILALLQLPPPVHGASLRNQSIIENERMNEQFEVDVINLSFSRRVDQVKSFGLGKFLKTMTVPFKLVSLLVCRKPVLVYFLFSPHGWAFCRDVILTFILKIFKKKILFHLREKGIKAKCKSRFQRMVYRNVFKNHRVICISKTMTEDIAEVYTGTPYVVYNGLKDPYMGHDFASKLINAEPVLLFLSNLTITKGINDYLLALKIIKKKNCAFKGIVVGAPHDLSKENLLELIDMHGLKGVVQYMGPLYGLEKFACLFNSDVLIFPTCNESFGNVAVEAMLAEVPVISTLEGSLGEIVINGENGFIVNQQDPEDIAEKLIPLIKNKTLRKRMGVKGRQAALKKYAFPRMMDDMISIFREMTAAGKK